MLEWSRKQFFDESQRLVDAWQCLSTASLIIPNNKNVDVLNSWSVEKDSSSGTLYLTHPPIRRELEIDRKYDDDTPNRNLEDSDSLDMYNDATVLHEDPVVASTPTLKNATKTTTTEWYFSIVYSDVWRVPILYFTVQSVEKSGSPCQRSEIISSLMQFSHYNCVEDTWEFFSYEEHPITGVPSFFLHPCRTSERMQTIMKEPQTNGDGGKDCLLLSWMSMILPCVGFGVPSKAYQELSRHLCSDGSKLI